MKRLILLILVFILTVQLTSAACCGEGNVGNCYPERNVCCGTPQEGYTGCRVLKEGITKPDLTNRTHFSYFCPGNYFGDCLNCTDKGDCKNDYNDCIWQETDEICKKEDGGCSIEYITISGKKLPFFPIKDSSICTNECVEGQVWDEKNKKCIDVEDLEDPEDLKDFSCTTDNCAKKCCKDDGTPGEGKGSICSGDNDKDNICNYYDNCPEVPNSATLGTCLPLTIKQTCSKTNTDCGTGGKCSFNQEDSNNDDIGDACQYEVSCESSYGDRQCCDELDPTATPADKATFFGFIGHCTKESLGGVFRGIGCWSKCVIKDKTTGEEITFEVGPCIDGQRTVKKLQNGVVIPGETKTEACSGIPLIPFFTNINLIFTLLILTLFYYFRER